MNVLIPILIIVFIVFMYAKNALVESRKEADEEKKFLETISIINQHEQLLLDNYQFYKHLPEFSRKRFVQRLATFINSHQFIGRSIKVEPQMKVIISAAAVKFSFGLDGYILSGFPRILVYPEEYLSKITGKYHKGDANAMGIMAFSWKHFKEGLDSADDNLNLGVHEFAHAYFLQQTKMNGESPFSDHDFEELREHIQKYNVINDTKNREKFRKYAFSNEMEFFAVMSEHFFETPSDFKSDTPQLYALFSKVLKQDPTKLGM